MSTEARFKCAGCGGYFPMPPLWISRDATQEGAKPYCAACDPRPFPNAIGPLMGSEVVPSR